MSEQELDPGVPILGRAMSDVMQGEYAEFLPMPGYVVEEPELDFNIQMSWAMLIGFSILFIIVFTMLGFWIGAYLTQ